MEITSVKVHKSDSVDPRFKGYATVTLDKCFVVNNIRIIQNEDKWQVFMPSKKLSNGKFEDMAHPINAETRKMFEDAILEEYNKNE